MRNLICLAGGQAGRRAGGFIFTAKVDSQNPGGHTPTCPGNSGTEKPHVTPQHANQRNSMSRFLRRRAKRAHPWQQSVVPIRLPTGPTPPLPVPAPRHRHLGSYTLTQFTPKKLTHLNLPDERTQLPHLPKQPRHLHLPQETYTSDKTIYPKNLHKTIYPRNLHTYTSTFFTQGTYLPTYIFTLGPYLHASLLLSPLVKTYVYYLLPIF